MNAIGTNIAHDPGALTDVIRKRLMALWDWRVAMIETKPEEERNLFEEELASFGLSFATGNFDPDWALPMLFKVLKMAGYIDQTDLVVRLLLDQYVYDRLPAVVDCVHAMIKTNHRMRWSYWPSRENLAAILRFALESGEGEMSAKAEEIVHLTGERGDRSFEPLLREFKAQPEGQRARHG